MSTPDFFRSRLDAMIALRHPPLAETVKKAGRRAHSGVSYP